MLVENTSTNTFVACSVPRCPGLTRGALGGGYEPGDRRYQADTLSCCCSWWSGGSNGQLQLTLGRGGGGPEVGGVVAGVKDRATGHGPRAGVGGRACRRADPDGFRRGRRSAGNSLSTYGSHARIGQTDRLCQFGCGILNACRSLIAWLTALVSSRLGCCPVFASAASWSPLRSKTSAITAPPRTHFKSGAARVSSPPRSARVLGGIHFPPRRGGSRDNEAIVRIHRARRKG